MKRPGRAGLLAALALALAALPALGPPAVEAAPAPAAVALQPVVNGGLVMPLLVTHAGDGSGRLFIVEQGGTVRVRQNGVLDATPYLDVAAKVLCCGERGLLGLAFHPNFEANGKLFVSYTRAGDGAVTLEKLIVADPAGGRPPTNGEVLLTVPHAQFGNHNGGMLAFGPDGFLYWAIGDGGGGNDPGNNAQNLNVLLGKMLRLDVDVPAGYAIPPGNPFAGAAAGRDEIWAYGLRNPWRFSFDRAGGDLYIGDVGQGMWEEVDRQAAGAAGGQNYGWDFWEGLALVEFRFPGFTPIFTPPIVTYAHSFGDCSITGGYVYHGAAAPQLAGRYVYGDFCTGRIWAARAEAGVWLTDQLLDTPHLVSSFGEDEAGEVYVVNYGGSVLRIVDA